MVGFYSDSGHSNPISSVSIGIGESITVYYQGAVGTGTISSSSSNTSVATVSQSGSGFDRAVTITGKASGTCTVTTGRPAASSKASITVNVGGSSTKLTISGPSSVTTKTTNAVWTADGASDPDTVEWSVTNEGLFGSYGSNGNKFTIYSFDDPGTFTITASQGGQTASKKVTITDATVYVTSLSVSKTSIAVDVGETTTFTVTPSPSNADNKRVSVSAGSNVSLSTSYNSSTGVTTVTVRGVSAGSTTIRVSTVDGSSITKSVSAVVADDPDIKVTRLLVLYSDTTFIVGETYYFSVQVTPSNATDKRVSWSTSGNATVSSSGTSYAYVTITGSGSFSVTATARDGSGVSNTASLSARAPSYVTNITLNASSTSITTEESVQINATISPSSADDRSLSWSISGPGTLSGTDNDLRWVTPTGPGTIRVTATANDGGGASRTVTINVREYVHATNLILSGLETVSGYDGRLEVPEKGTASFTATVVPSDSDDIIGYEKSSSAFNTSSSGNNPRTITVTGVSIGTGTITVYAGDIRKTVLVEVVPAVIPVTSVEVHSDAAGTKITSIKLKQQTSETLYARAYPITATDRTLTYSFVSGSDVAEVSGWTMSSSGSYAIFTLKALVPGNAVLRITSVSTPSVYVDFPIEVVDKWYADSVSILGPDTVYQGFTTSLQASTQPSYAEEDLIWSIDSGSEYVAIAGQTGWNKSVQLMGLSPGEAVIRVTTADTGRTATKTVIISDEYPYDSQTQLTFRFGILERKTVTGIRGRRVHGGNFAVTLQEGLTFMSATTIIPPSSQSTLIADSYAAFQGTPNELGERIVYATGEDGTLKIIVKVDPAGPYTKRIIWDANLPDGAVLMGELPENLEQMHTGETFDFMIPEMTAYVPGYIFVGWREVNDNTTVPIYNATQKITVEGGDVDKTMYAEWYPIPQGATGGGLDNTDPFIIELSVGESIERTIFNYNDTPQVYGDEPSGIEGVKIRIGSALYDYPPFGSWTPATNGNIVVTGAPLTGSQMMGFSIRGTRDYFIFYRFVSKIGPGVDPDSELYVLDAMGGTFPGGRSRMTMSVKDGGYRLPDWSVVDRPGYTLSHWVGHRSGRAEQGSEQTSVDIWDAQWVVGKRYDGETVPHAAVRIYRAVDEYVDCTYLQVEGGEAVVEMAENRPGTISMTLVNEYDTPTRSIMSPRCTMWSKGSAGAIGTGMYVRIDDIGSDGVPRYLADGFITTISPEAETVAIEIGDRLTFLSKSGTTLRRNYYGRSRGSSYFDVGHDEEKGLYVDLSSLAPGFVIDGAVMWTISDPVSSPGTTLTTLANNPSDEMLFVWSFQTSGMSRIGALGINMARQRMSDIDPVMIITGTAVLTSSLGSVSVDWTSDEPVSDGGFVASMPANLSVNRDGDTVRVEFWINKVDKVRRISIATSPSSTNTLYIASAGTTENRSVNATIYTYTNARATTTGIEEGRLWVSAVENQDINDEMLWIPPQQRALVPYIAGDDAGRSTVDIAENIADALGYIFQCDDSAMEKQMTAVKIFRTGGGYAQDYLQKLSDIPSAQGRMRAYCARGYTTPFIVMGTRYTKADGARLAICYAKDEYDGDAERVNFSSFSPRMTMKNRPSLVTLRGTMSDRGSSDSIPLIVSMEDADSSDRRYGLVVESVVADSHVNSERDAATMAWSEVTSNALDQWEGTVTLPGIRSDLMASTGPYAGSGIPVVLNDSRNGIVSYKARVVGLKCNYNTCSTTLTLSNHSLRYSSGLADTVAMAITSADICTGDNTTTLFNTQFVRVRTEIPQTILESENEIKGKLEDIQDEFSFEKVAIYKLPNGRKMIVARAPPGGDNHSKDDTPYAVKAFKVNGGVWMDVNPSIRPDYYAGQTLIVNIDCP